MPTATRLDTAPPTLPPPGEVQGYKRPKHAPRSLFDPAIVRRAIGESFRKLDPRMVARNPVMFVVEVGSVALTFLLIRDLFTGGHDLLYNAQITLWLWFTVLFANFAEAMAEGRGKAQADTLRKAKTETVARRLVVARPDSRQEERVPGAQLRKGDLVVVEASELIPGDGEVIDGI